MVVPLSRLIRGMGDTCGRICPEGCSQGPPPLEKGVAIEQSVGRVEALSALRRPAA